ncbi:MAG: crotonase/enoyl-CoA hydratase family protein [Acidimicrobiales bacterium]|nr:crotonase/enoyl-CoA hydratase family protein [Acidimicrobiales bacterium]
MTDDAALPTYRLDDSVAVISLDDGKANVFSSAVVAHLEGLLDRVEADGARALVIIGRPGKFSAGFDLAEMSASTESMRSLVAAGARWMYRLYGLGIPTVAACTGHALAAGALTLLSCDLRIGAEVPAKIGLNEVAIGLTLPIFGVELGRDRLLPTAHAEAIVAATVYDPAGAAAVGYLDRVVPAEDLEAEALAAARHLGELRSGAYGGTKDHLRGERIARVLAGLDADIATMELPG